MLKRNSINRIDSLILQTANIYLSNYKSHFFSKCTKVKILLFTFEIQICASTRRIYIYALPCISYHEISYPPPTDDHLQLVFESSMWLVTIVQIAYYQP